MQSDVPKICFVIGDPISHSLSPAMHNAAYRALGIDTEYSFEAKHVTPNQLAYALQNELRAPHIHGFAVTIPHKESIIQYLDEIDETAKEIGAANTVLNNNGKLIGYNTDWHGALNALKKVTSLKSKRVALLGSGGTARAITYGLSKEGCEITTYSRKTNTWVKREDACKADIIINTTPIGRDDDSSPLSGESITEHHIVFDVNYRKRGTQLLNLAKAKNTVVVNGLEMLLQQGMLQFELFTRLKAPEDAMRKALKDFGL